MYCNFSFPGKVNSFTAVVRLVLLARFTVHKERKEERILQQIHLANLEARDVTADLLWIKNLTDIDNWSLQCGDVACFGAILNSMVFGDPKSLALD